MFRKLRVKNFRSIEDSRDISLTNLNIFVGPNNSGKSSLIYTLLLIKQTLEDTNPENVLVTCGPHVDLGSYLDIIRGHNPKGKLGIEFELYKSAITKGHILGIMGLTETSAIPYNKYQVTLKFNTSANKIEIDSFKVGYRGGRSYYSGESDSDAWKLEGVSPNLLNHVQPEFIHFLPYITSFGEIPKDKKIVASALKLFLSSAMKISVVKDIMNNLLYVGPIRERIPRYGILGTMPYTELGPSGQNLMRVLSESDIKRPSGKTMIQELNYWLDTKFGILKKVRIINIDKGRTVKALIADDPRGVKDINLAAMGSGLSQIVPVIVQTVLTPENGCLIIEQPEIHLHPAAQANLGDLFVEYSKENKQLIVETHSEHLLLRVRRRIAEGKIDPKLVTVYFVSKRGGKTKFRRLDLKNDGHFSKWPKGFFEEGYKEAMAIVEAQFSE